MAQVIAAVFLFNLVYIAALPFIFFRRDGVFNFFWFLTGAPFFICGVGFILFLAGILNPYTSSETASWLGLLFSLLSICLIAYTCGTNRVPLSLWHQKNDKPQNIVTYGAYKRIRHPFYTAFLLCLAGACIFFPHLITFASLAYAITVLNWTAAREEQRLSGSEFGEEYRSYMGRTGRFWPRW